MPQYVLAFQAWYGGGEWLVEVLKETPQRFLIRATTPMMIPGGRRLMPGETAYVAKSVVRAMTNQNSEQERPSDG
ncbi:MAG: hypothetical protein NZ481_09220 [Candidatus Kapabacteria bacterium]|nr:hypothetical protein [Candidatus Kapabacteria bacterium]